MGWVAWDAGLDGSASIKVGQRIADVFTETPWAYREIGVVDEDDLSRRDRAGRSADLRG
jgi:hypothetical protein